MSTGVTKIVKPAWPTTHVYVDGFNLHYRAMKHGRFGELRWLDIVRFCRLLLPHNHVTLVRYAVSSRSSCRCPTEESCASRRNGADSVITAHPLFAVTVDVVAHRFRTETSGDEGGASPSMLFAPVVPVSIP